MRVRSPEELKKAGRDISQSIGKTLDTFESARGSAGEEKTQSRPKRLSDYTGFRFFSLGPVYELLGVPFDILGEFHDLTGDPFTVITLEFKHPFVEPLADWSRVVQGVPSDVFETLKRHLETQGAHFGEERLYSEIVGVEMLVEDPLERDEASVVTGLDALVTVFVPTTVRYSVMPASRHGSLPIRLYRNPPEARIALLGKATGNEPVTEGELQAFFDKGTLPPEIPGLPELPRH